jgi:hypothetical protein
MKDFLPSYTANACPVDSTRKLCAASSPYLAKPLFIVFVSLETIGKISKHFKTTSPFSQDVSTLLGKPGSLLALMGRE